MDWWKEIISALLIALTGFLGGGFFQKRKARADAEGGEIANLSAQVETMQKMLKTWEEQYDLLKKSLTTLQNEFEEYKKKTEDKIQKLTCDKGKPK